jgi:hypothetical protein
MSPKEARAIVREAVKRGWLPAPNRTNDAIDIFRDRHRDYMRIWRARRKAYLDSLQLKLFHDITQV